MPGPLPDPNRRRRNAPTIPTTKLPLSGRSDPAPEVPAWTDLRASGRSWWDWAWATPQAAAWGTAVGMESLVARRASLEDDLAALDDVDGLDFGSLGDEKAAREFRAVVGRVAALATGRLSLMREMREMDDRLGLTPRGMAALRWTVIDDAPKAKVSAGVSNIDDRRKRLTDAS